MPPIRQSSFARGEISPTLYGQTEWEGYKAALRQCRNWIITPQGAALNRPGTQFIKEVKNSAKKVRLVPFILSDTDTFVLEFGDLYVRFYKNGTQVTSGGSAYEVVTTYAEADLPYLKWVQVGDTIIITHKDHAARELERIADDNWTIGDFTFDPGDAQFGASHPMLLAPLPTADADHPVRTWTWKVTTVIRDNQGRLYETKAYNHPGGVWEQNPRGVTQWNAGTTYALGAHVSYDPTVIPYSGSVYTSLQNGNTNHIPTSGAPWWAGSTPVMVGITALAPTEVAVYPDKPVYVSWQTYALTIGIDYEVVGYRVYRGRGTVFGLIGDTTSETFIDYGDEPDYTIQPPSGRNPFQVFTGGTSPSVLRTEKPIAITLFEQRLVLAGSNERPEWVWLSRTNDYSNFDNPIPSADDSEVELALASLKREDVRSVVGLERLYIFTSGGLWTLNGVNGPLTRTAIPQVAKQSSVGASWLTPLVVGDALLYVRAKGVGISDAAYDQQRDRVGTQDISLFAHHLVDNHSIVEWAYAEDPYRIVWAVRDDGVLLAVTYERGQQILAWHAHTSEDGDGLFESVCTVPEGAEDAVYTVVKRTIGGVTKRYIERFASRQVTDATYGVFLDASVTYDGSPATTVSGLDHLEGKTVTALADGNVVVDLTVTSGAVTLPEAASVVTVGLPYLCDLELLDAVFQGAETGDKYKIVKTVTFEAVASRGLWVGESVERLQEWEQRQVIDSYGPVASFTGKVKVTISSSWNTGGRAFLRQTYPLPVGIYAVTRGVELGQ